MIKNKKAAGHVDWTISIGIFLIFLMSILLFIKPVYKPAYQSETLGEIIKDSFLEENTKTIYRTFIYYSGEEECDYIQTNINNLPESYVTNEIFVPTEDYKEEGNSISFSNPNNKYWVYHNLETGQGNNGNFEPSGNACDSSKVIGETTEYMGLKSTSITSFNVPNFPDTKDFNIKTRNTNTGEVIDTEGEEPPEDISVYSYEFIYPLLEWENNEPKKTNYIISIQIW